MSSPNKAAGETTLFRTVTFLICFVLAGFADAAHAATYFLDPSGSDSSAGTSAAAPWKTIGRLEQVALRPGDIVYLKAGATFAGPLILDSKDGGNSKEFVTITSGKGGDRATITGTTDGVIVADTGGINLVNLRIAARNAARGTGVLFYSSRIGVGGFGGVRIRNVEVSGFLSGGIVFYADDFFGFHDILIENVSAHDNGRVGIAFGGRVVRASEGNLPYSHADVRVRHSSAFHNRGDPDPSYASNSGNGIVLGEVSGGLIEYCSAYENGGLGVNPGGGPIGIWAYDSTGIIIQRNRSWGNRTGNRYDGGGFDLDGGTSNSIVQYNFSHDNAGAGFLVAQLKAARPFHDNIVRWNISENDGRANGYASLSAYAEAEIKQTTFYNNSVYTTPTSSPGPAAVRITGSENITGLLFANNLLLTDGSMTLINLEAENHGISFVGNLMWNFDGPLRLVQGSAAYDSLQSWRGATGLERLNGADTGIAVDPLLVRKPGKASPYYYTLQPGSAADTAGVDRTGLLGEYATDHDYFDAVVTGHHRLIGAVAPGAAR